MVSRPRPTFVFIGADRCGSKWLHRVFSSHPQCFVPDIADPYFFDRQYHRGLEWYLRLFADAPPSALALGEFSHDYIHSAEAARRMRRDLGPVRILATLRHPVDRAYSDWAHSTAVGLAPRVFEEALEEVPTLLSNSLYAEKLSLYFELFGRESVHVMLYDRLMADPTGLAQDAFEFVGLPRTGQTEFGRAYNPYRESRGAWGGKMARKLADLLRARGQERLLGRLRHVSAVRGLFFKEASKEGRPRMEAATRASLLEYFGPEVVRLERLLDADLAAWRH